MGYHQKEDERKRETNADSAEEPGRVTGLDDAEGGRQRCPTHSGESRLRAALVHVD